MRRREFIKAFGSAALAFPLPARAQKSAIPVLGSLNRPSPGTEAFGTAFRRGLKQMGFVEGQNLLIEGRWPNPNEDLREAAAELVRKQVAVIFTADNGGALAAKAATSQIPIVFVVGLDPVAMGLVATINRPGGNATGVSFQVSALEPKRFELLRALLPAASLIGVLVNPDNPNADPSAVRLAASASGLQLLVMEARSLAEVESAFAQLVQRGANALLVTSDRLFNLERRQLVDFAARAGIPTIYPWRDFADAGGLMSYGNSLTDAFRQGGLYVGRILRGDKPASLPIWQPTRFEFVINLKTAKAMGLDIPPALLAFADEVIE
ncbi:MULTISPECIES: ABC transporter substrate-binding protein [Bradyrhizobium]|uniref:ABC transporter substrate-binding protein n=1 Tax=Bradyrhizobium TaxID=374 RepID=UPI00155E5D26|nr:MULTISPECIES: ABC transporter substrate-binding protein [Bradyrhizobium]MDD1517972.1 ABC transporter substrate-binding protein [Bradyrhizobium sp. WBAH30]MDD1540681.1 ABC transporter substrate-binding protein [Bradyrhizobium sp. WBAH41]MDD1555873.1 ABC transporter substrate-binding protein [Bradyrhizobium sp. WBAH23]MDD1563316.1 ABC transporter substrate-binding protein [Bradyrhizobium sp. WBAH33]MDD1588181.1 ABC transporter substrate-binding protein [Bradyrhizobium sp. WBAH42]